MNKRFLTPVVMVFLAAMVIGFGDSAQAITGLGFGAKLGEVTEYDNPKLKLADAKFSDFKAYGVFVKFGSKSVDVEFGFDWSKDKQEKTLFGEKVEVEAKDFSTHATAKFVFQFPVLRPFIGGGLAAHRFSYTYSGQLGEFDDVTVSIPADETFLGFHIVVGAKLQFGALPFQPFVEGKLSKVNSNPSTDITVISAGVIFSFL